MQRRFLRQSALLVGLVLLVSVFVVDAGGQTRRKRRARRVTPRPVITNPVIAPPGTEQNPGADSERIISTVDETPAETGKTAGQAQPKNGKPASKKTSDDAEMKETINELSNQVDRLNDKLSQMQENDRSLIDMERLTRAEQRAESLRLQQIDVESKLADLQARLEQVEYALKPENIERASGFGTVHPEEAREARRRQLETEKKSTQAQIRILETSRARLETAVSTADAEVDALRRRIEAQRAQESVGGSPSTERRAPASRPRPE
jgi:DNA repair exonuclease SbcCD ATPase subunit